MAETSFNSFFNNSNSFGLTVKSHEKTMAQLGQTLTNTAGGVLEPLFTYLEENEKVFSGDVTKELNKTFAENFTLNMALNNADEAVNGKRPKFDSKF